MAHTHTHLRHGRLALLNGNCIDEMPHQNVLTSMSKATKISITCLMQHTSTALVSQILRQNADESIGINVRDATQTLPLVSRCFCSSAALSLSLSLSLSLPSSLALSLSLPPSLSLSLFLPPSLFLSPSFSLSLSLSLPHPPPPLFFFTRTHGGVLLASLAHPLAVCAVPGPYCRSRSANTMHARDTLRAGAVMQLETSDGAVARTLAAAIQPGGLAAQSGIQTGDQVRRVASGIAALFFRWHTCGSVHSVL